MKPPCWLENLYRQKYGAQGNLALPFLGSVTFLRFPFLSRPLPRWFWFLNLSCGPSLWLLRFLFLDLPSTQLSLYPSIPLALPVSLEGDRRKVSGPMWSLSSPRPKVSCLFARQYSNTSRWANFARQGPETELGMGLGKVYRIERRTREPIQRFIPLIRRTKTQTQYN